MTKQVQAHTFGTLVDCEQAIENYITSYQEAAQALLDVRENELWRNGPYTSFEHYVMLRWEISKARAIQLCNAGLFLRRLAVDQPTLPAPEIETHVRPIMRIKPLREEDDDDKAWQRRINAWQLVLDKAKSEDMAVTQEFVAGLVNRYFLGGDKVKVARRKKYTRADVEAALGLIADVAGQVDPKDAVEMWGHPDNWEFFDDAIQWLRQCDAIL